MLVCQDLLGSRLVDRFYHRDARTFDDYNVAHFTTRDLWGLSCSVPGGVCG